MSFRRDKNKKIFEFVNGKGLFYDGFAAVKLNDGSGYSFVDVFGNVWDERYDQTQDFVGGMAVVRIRDGRESYFYLIDTNGHFLREDGRYKISSECIFNHFDRGYAQYMNILDRNCCVARNGFVIDEKYGDVEMMTGLFDNVVAKADYQYILNRESQLADKTKLLEALLFELQYRIDGRLHEKIANGKREAYIKTETILKNMLSEKYQNKVAPYIAENEREM